MSELMYRNRSEFGRPCGLSGAENRSHEPEPARCRGLDAVWRISSGWTTSPPLSRRFARTYNVLASAIPLSPMSPGAPPVLAVHSEDEVEDQLAASMMTRAAAFARRGTSGSSSIAAVTRAPSASSISWNANSAGRRRRARRAVRSRNARR